MSFGPLMVAASGVPFLGNPGSCAGWFHAVPFHWSYMTWPPCTKNTSTLLGPLATAARPEFASGDPGGGTAWFAAFLGACQRPLIIEYQTNADGDCGDTANSWSAPGAGDTAASCA